MATEVNRKRKEAGPSIYEKIKDADRQQHSMRTYKERTAAGISKAKGGKNETQLNNQAKNSKKAA